MHLLRPIGILRMLLTSSKPFGSHKRQDQFLMPMKLEDILLLPRPLQGPAPADPPWYPLAVICLIQAYSVTKAAAIHTSKCLAKALAPKIRVNTISPSMIKTEWSARFGEDKIKTHIAGTCRNSTLT